MATLVSEDLVIPEGEIRNYSQNSELGFVAALRFFQLGSFQPSLFNYGEMRLQSDSTVVQRLITFDTSSFWDRAIIANHGKISANLPTADYVFALYASSWSPDLMNAGTIEVAARIQAIGYESWDSSLTINNLATGSISATARENVLTLYLANGATVTNAGQILATATGGSDVRNSVAISMPNGGANVINSGLIRATDNSLNPYAVAISFYGFDQNTVVNSGTISGDYAIRENNPYGYNAWANVRNTGLIEGIISLSSGNDVVVNAGQIKGEVNLGAHSDLYDGALGTIVGTVSGGDGGDLLVGGAGRDNLDGGAGDDVLFGRGGDTLTGGAGRDTFVFTGIVAGAPVEIITDFVSGTDKIDLRSLAPTSVTINGSSISIGTQGGTLAISVSGTVTMSDILTAGTGTTAGTAASDTLIAGPEGAVLSGGDGADLLVGGAGHDRLDGGFGDNTGEYGDLMWGGLGDDTYVIDNALDLVIENPGGGYDTIEVPINNPWPVVIPDNVERSIGGSAYGNALDNVMIGSESGDVLMGMGGNDTIDGGGGLFDQARYSGSRADYLIENVTIGGLSYVRITGQSAAAGDGVDLLRNVEFVQFNDQLVAIGNERPVLGSPAIDDQTVGDGQVYNYQIPLGAFTDPNPGDVLTYSATLADGSPLPAWLVFNPATRTFSGSPPFAAIGTVLQVKVTATDNFPGDPGSLVSDVFALTIVQAPGADVTGTPNADTLSGTFRAERMFGLDSDDTLNGSDGADSLDGGDGFDIVDYTSSSNVTVNLTTGIASGGMSEGDQFVSIEGLRGSNGDDHLTGSAGNNSVWGQDGNDLLTGGGGNDLLDGGEGSGDVAIFFGDRAGYLIEHLVEDGIAKVRVTGQGAAAGDGIDLLIGIEIARFADQDVSLANIRPALGAPAMPDQSAGDGVTYSYQVPAEAFFDANGNALSFTATLADGAPLPGWLSFNPATRTFSGTPPFAAIGTVLQVKVTATDNFPGDPLSLVSDVFALTIVEAPGVDVNGTASPDTLNGTFRAERMFGLDSDDVLGGSDGADQIDGGNGNDTVSYAGSGSAVAVVLLSGQGSSGQATGDTYVSIENVTGSTFGDLLIGNAGANVLTGNGGIDTLDGGAGNDRLVVSAAGNGSSVDGGADSDTLVVSGAVTLGSITSIEAIEMASWAALTLTGAQFASGLAANSVLSGTGSIIVNVTSGTAFTASAITLAGGGNIGFTVNGSADADVIKAFFHTANTINGDGGNDQIRGGLLADSINGGEGNDKILGYSGADLLTGGAGNDQFRYLFAADSGIGAGADQITDFVIGADRINLSQLDTDAVTPGLQGFAFVGTSAFSGGGAAQVRYLSSASNLIVQADINGDGAADMEIVLQGLIGQTLTSAEFMLGTPPPVQEPLSAKDAAPQVMDPLLDAAKLPAEGLAASEPLLTVSFVDPLDFPDHGLMRWGTPHSDWLPLG